MNHLRFPRRSQAQPSAPLFSGLIFNHIARDPKQLLHLKVLVDTTIVMQYIFYMVDGLAQEIKQTRKFTSLEGEAGLNILRTSEILYERLNATLKKLDLTFTQYNALRILRGADAQGVTCSQLAERMIVRDPDVTRMLDRLEKRELVQRSRSKKDRRQLIVTISAAGSERLKAADRPVREAMEASLKKLGTEKLAFLIQALEQARS
jgi:DNA-binding MarR family transcriptional regulator